MGLINNDTMETKSDLLVPVGAYMSIGTNALDTIKENGKYTIQYGKTRQHELPRYVHSKPSPTPSP